MKKLFYQDPFRKSCQARVVSATPKDDCFHVVLDQTIFYPEGGGQPCDQGYIDGKRVCDVFEQNGTVYHILDQVPKGEGVFCELDWPRRLYHMQHHTGQHLLSAVLLKLYRCETVSFHLGENYATIDISAGVFPEEKIEQTEAEVNQWVQQDLPIRTHLVNRAELSKFPIRKNVDIEGETRLVEIAGLDFSPCCGTHLLSTGQVGLLKILKAEKYKSMTRLYFLCGARALSDYASKHKIVTALAAAYSTAEEDILARVQAENERVKSLTQEVKLLKAELWDHRAEQIAKTAQRQLVEATVDEMADAEVLAQALFRQGSYIAAVTCGNRMLLAHDGSFSLHCGDFIKEKAAQFGGRGGGSATSAQVFFEGAEQQKAFRNLVVSEVFRNTKE